MLSILHNVRRGIGAQVMRVIDYAHFALNKFESLSITFWYNTLHFIIFNLDTMCTLDCNISLVKFLNIESRYSFSHVSREMYIFGFTGRNWPPKMIIDWISLSLSFKCLPFSFFLSFSLPLLFYVGTCYTFGTQVIARYANVSLQITNHSMLPTDNIHPSSYPPIFPNHMIMCFFQLRLLWLLCELTRSKLKKTQEYTIR